VFHYLREARCWYNRTHLQIERDYAYVVPSVQHADVDAQ
jgi:hypothetical protein